MGFQLHPEQLVERLRLSLAHLIVGVVEGQNDAEMQLLAHPLEVGDILALPLSEFGGHETVVFLQSLDDRTWREVQLGQPAAIVFHLFDEFQRRGALCLATTRENPGRCAKGDG